jgi:HlyD family secretion protein
MKSSPELAGPAISGNGAAKTTAGPRRTKRLYWLAAIGVVLVAAIVVALVLRPKSQAQYLTVAVSRQTLIESVTATGTVNPQDTILVGSQVSGTIQAIFADYNDYVHQGQVLARLDPTLFQGALAQAQGTLAQAEGNYQVALAAEGTAQADVVKARAALGLAKLTQQRDRSLLRNGYVSQSQYDSDEANLITAQASLNSAVAAVNQAEKTAVAAAAVASADRAQVQQAQTNLNHTVIISPTDGTVIQRNVSVGQTVAAALAAPTLFTVGKDLAKMEIDLAVGEPDVGNVQPGDPVDFTVLAYPNLTFHGRVAQVRENPTTVQNVVTYDAVVYENNKDGRLRPGMTPTASIEVAHADNSLVVPLAALSFGASLQQRPSSSVTSHPAPASSTSPWGNAGSAESATFVAGSTGRVVVLEDGKPRAVPVRVTLVNAGEAAVVPIAHATLADGDDVVISLATRANQAPARAPGMFR